MATSKNQKSGTKNKGKVLMAQEKRVKPRKETILIEATEEIINQVYDVEGATVEVDGVNYISLNGKAVLGITMRYGKKYFKVRNA